MVRFITLDEAEENEKELNLKEWLEGVVYVIDSETLPVNVRSTGELEKEVKRKIEEGVLYDKVEVLKEEVFERGSEIHVFRLVGVQKIVNKQLTNKKLFKTREELAEYIEREAEQYSRICVVAHNLEFDLSTTNLDIILNERGWYYTLFNLDTRSFFIMMKKGKNQILFWDSYNILVDSVQNLAKTFGLGEKVAIEDFATVDEETLIRRALTDVEIEGKMIISMLNVFEQLGIDLKLTLSKTSYAYLTEGVHFDFSDVLNDESFLKGSVLSYRGGRTEMYYKGKQESVYIFDVNSLYPYVMYQFPYPVHFKYKTRDRDQIKNEIKNGNCVLAKVYFYNDSNIGVKYEERLVFPKGGMVSWLNTREIEYLIEKNLLRSVEEAYVFEGRKIFERIKTLYDMRMRFKKEGKESLQYITKILMNSGYGRFGYRVEELGYDRELALELEAIGYNIKEYEWGNYYFFRITNIYKYNPLTIIAAEVTSNARMHITRYKDLVEREGGKVYYMDTDSLFADRKGKEILYEHNLVGNELGLLKEEYSDVNVEFILPKVYSIYDKEGKLLKKKMKGVSRDALLLYTDEELMRFKDQSGTSILVNRGIVRGAVIWKNIEKQLKLNEYKKGIVTESGWIKPLVLDGYNVEDNDKVVFI